MDGRNMDVLHGHHPKKKAILITLNIIILLMVTYLLFMRNFHTEQPPNLISFVFTVFAGYLFFLLMPIELIFIYFVGQHHHHPAALVTITVMVAMISQTLDFLIGRFAGEKLIIDIINPRHYDRAKHFLIKFGALTIFLFNLFPLSSPLLSLISGILQYPYRLVFIYSSMGLLLKYGIIAYFISTFS
jgi:membrane protein DedA with SNARE-associated domain